MKTEKMIFILALISLTIIPGAWCEAGEDEEQVYAVQNRIFHKSHELDFYAGYISGDDFYKVYPIGLGYTYHFNELFSWEVARAQYMITSERDLKRNLEQDFGVTPENFPEPQFMVHSHFVVKPLYGKSAILNRDVVNHEVYLFGGPGMVHSEKKYSTGRTDGENDFSLSFGAGFRYFISKKYCLNFEIRDLVNFREDDTQSSLNFIIGFGYRFNMTPRKVEEDPTTLKLKRILDEK